MLRFSLQVQPELPQPPSARLSPVMRLSPPALPPLLGATGVVRCPHCAACFDADAGVIIAPPPLDASAALPSDARSKKRARQARYVEKQNTKALTVRRDAVRALKVLILFRLAKQLRVSVRRTRKRKTADIRREVVAAMVERECESMELT